MFIHKRKEHYDVIAAMSWVTYLTTVQEMKLGTRYRHHPYPLMNAELPVVGIKIDDLQCSALIDTGCSRSIVCANCCQM